MHFFSFLLQSFSFRVKYRLNQMSAFFISCFELVVEQFNNESKFCSYLAFQKARES